MKVLQIVPELNAGGVERTTLEIAEALSAKGYTPHICSAGGRLEPELKALGAVLHLFDVGSKNPFSLGRNTKRLIDIIQTENIDIVHARSRAPAWPAFKAAQKTNVPFVTTYHGIYNAGNAFKRRYNSIMTRGEMIIANSGYTRDHIVKEHGISSSKITVIPRGVDMAVFDPDIIKTGDVEKLKKSWQSQASEKTILLPGRLTSWKGQEVAVLALASLPKSCKLVLLGDAQGRDNYVNKLWEIAGQQDVENQLVIPGHTRDVATALSAADIVIAPSTDPEAFGRVVTEAQAMGRPVIASAHGGPMETVLTGKTGELVPPNRPDALAKAIENVLGWTDYDPHFARDHVARHFSKKQLQDATLQVYSQLLM